MVLCRRRRRALVVLACLGLMWLTGCGERTAALPPSASASGSGGNRDLPAGWRWESFGGVQVGVPGEWGWTNGSSRIGQWCVHAGRPGRTPAVGRPGVATAVGCPFPDDGTVPQEMLVRHTGEIVAFQPVVDDLPEDRGDRRTVVAGGVAVVIQTSDPALRDRIAETVHEVEVDAAGCPSDDPVSGEPGRRPPAGGDLAGVVGVRWVVACKYAVRYPGYPSGIPALLGSRRFDGEAAAELVKALEAAPVGGGPNAPARCMAEYSYGEEILVLAIGHEAGTHRVVVTYSGCNHNGIDDGSTVRRLTRAAMQPLTSEALTINGAFSGVMGDILSFD